MEEQQQLDETNFCFWEESVAVEGEGEIISRAKARVVVHVAAAAVADVDVEAEELLLIADEGPNNDVPDEAAMRRF